MPESRAEACARPRGISVHVREPSFVAVVWTLVRTYDLRSLHGKTVLVHSACDHHNPQSAVRGTIEIRREAGEQRVAVTLEFPQMMTTRAHRRTRLLAEDEVVQLLASENNGAFELTLPERLDPAEPPGNE